MNFKDNLKNNALNYLFYALYIGVATATFRHSTYGFASNESGSTFWAALAAMSLDIGMILSATFLRRTRNTWLILGLIVSAIGSTYTQLLYAFSTAQAMTIAPGAEWLGDFAVFVTNIRVLLLPSLLPVLSIIYAFASKTQAPTKHTDLQRKVDSILAQGLGKHDTARQVWGLSSNGYGFTVPEVAELAGCSIKTAERAREE